MSTADSVTDLQVSRHGPDHFSNLPVDIHLLFLEAIIYGNTFVDADGQDSCRHAVYTLISASPAIFRVFQAYRPRILRLIHQSLSYTFQTLITRDPSKWARKGVQQAALAVASIPTYPENTTMTFSEARSHIESMHMALVYHQETIKFNPPEDPKTLAKLIRVIHEASSEFAIDTNIFSLIEYQLYERICTLLPQNCPSQIMSTDESFVWHFRAGVSNRAFVDNLRGWVNPRLRVNLNILSRAKADYEKLETAGFEY